MMYHIVVFSLLLTGTIPYRPLFKYTGIALISFMAVHIIFCIPNCIHKEERKKKFYLLKWVTGILMILIMTVHGSDYVKEVSFLGIHINKGAAAACIESLFLVLSTLHIRLNIRAICEHLGMDERKTLICGRVACGISTLMILLPGIAIWKYFL